MPQTENAVAYDLTPLYPILEQGRVILTPNLRLGRKLREAWNVRQAQAGLQSWPSVRVYSIEAYLEKRWRQAVALGQVAPRRLLSSLHMRELWQRVIKEDQAANGGYHLLQLDSAAALAQQARENLLRARIDISERGIRSQFQLDPDCACYLRWLERMEAVLADLAAGTLSDALTDLLGVAGLEPCDEVRLLDFDDIPRLFVDSLDQLAASHAPISGAQGDVLPQVIAFDDKRSEIDAVAAAAARHYRETPALTFGIVLSDMHGDRAALEYALRREFDCLGANYTSLPVNFSTGISLDRAPVVRDALAMLEVQTGEVELDVLLMLLGSRFTMASDLDEDKLVQLVKRLSQDGAASIDTGRLRYLAQQVEVAGESGTALGAALRKADELRLLHAQQTPAAWVASIGAILECWQWPGSGPLDSIEHQQVTRWFEVLDTFAGFDEHSGEITLASALALLRRCCQDQVSQPQTADSSIQVLGPLEGAGLQFDALWLSGFQGNRWPAPARPNPFIPTALQRASDMPHCSPEREWEYAVGLLSQYRGACNSLFISYALEIDGVSELPSALLEGFDITAASSTATIPEEWRRRQADANRETVVDSAAPPAAGPELETISGGSSILQNQAACPFKAFARHRLHLEPLGDPVVGLSASERGNLLHGALFILWGEIENSDTLVAMPEPERRLAARRAAATAVAEMSQAQRQIAGAACLDIEQQRLENLMLEWLALESQRDPFAVTEREASLEMELAGIPFRLRVDRIDTLAGGERLVIDYKSGRNGLADWLGERMRQPQLPLYGIATGVDAASFAQVRARESKFVGLGAATGVPGIKDDVGAAIKRWEEGIDDWPALVDSWRQNLTALAEAFVAGEATVDPLANACNYCGLEAVCRVQIQEAQA
ncbi:PD-(D/E)XK nuclease family protein [Halioglobus maricola]|uniref:PD-(D/E)XK nuclease family protein n=1 Tax=Halioglobus maricola TaxID=2601894 RepID=UPI001479177E|nr:PD-(D/E)XK nuclease family protein [Halioglobus maricola]